MIIVKFQGALGNQMFEYAFLLKLQKIFPDTDILGYIENITDFNGYELGKVFGIDFKQANWKQVSKLANLYPKEMPGSKIFNLFAKIRLYKYGYKDSHIKEDDNTAFYPQIWQLNPLYSYFLDGVWANAEYIDDIRTELIEKYSFPSFTEENNIRLEREMLNNNSVCIHVRRNEYVTMGLTVTSDEYYKKAIKMICDKVSDPVFYVFSDDHEYCDKLFSGLIDYTLVTGNSKDKSYRDMQLMTKCKHNIIANSTFSFWGAFLGTQQDKIVIAPNVSWGNMRHSFARREWIILDAT